MAPNHPISVEDDHLNAWPLNAKEISHQALIKALSDPYVRFALQGMLFAADEFDLQDLWNE